MSKTLLFFVFFVFSFTYLEAYELDNYDLEETLDITYPKSFINKWYKFYTQAPFSTKKNWYKHYESCEEASIYLLHNNINWNKISAKYMDENIDKMNIYQENIWISVNKIHSPKVKKLYLRDISIFEIDKHLAKEYYWYDETNSHIIKSPNESIIKYLLSKWYSLIIPNHTDFLKNPHLITRTYHVIVLTWYNERYFYSLEPATIRWSYFRYDISDIISGIKNNWDWVLVLEWSLNKWNIDFKYLKSKKDFKRKSELLLKVFYSKMYEYTKEDRKIFLTSLKKKLKKIYNTNDSSENKRLALFLILKINKELRSF